VPNGCPRQQVSLRGEQLSLQIAREKPLRSNPDNVAKLELAAGDRTPPDWMVEREQ
jgi:hypothetical protein